MFNSKDYLKELSTSDFQIKGDEPDITGWKVKDESGATVGTVMELLFEPKTAAVRYIVIDLSGNDYGIVDKKVMVPLGIAELHENDDEVILPGIHLDQYNLLPEYDFESLSADIEMQIREIIGSPAALRLEEAMIEFDRNRFYDHHHFYKNKFQERKA